jgi:endonuclease/exonuclease/phosphatase family metal-dependent hydrolase
MKSGIALVFLMVVSLGCRSVRQPKAMERADFNILTYNVNWGGAGADQVARFILESGAEIVCLQETTPEWERIIKREASRDYLFSEFRESKGRMGGGLAFLSKVPAREIAYIPSETGWFDGWVVEFATAAGPVQVLNVHLRPPVSDRGGWVSGYLNTRDDRVTEMERFYKHVNPGVPLVVAGDFNDSEDSQVVEWLEKRGLTNALPQFDRSTPTWRWKYRGVSLKRRMDHVVYSPELVCAGAKVIEAGPSDHFPVLAWFWRK